MDIDTGRLERIVESLGDLPRAVDRRIAVDLKGVRLDQIDDLVDYLEHVGATGREMVATGRSIRIDREAIEDWARRGDGEAGGAVSQEPRDRAVPDSVH